MYFIVTVSARRAFTGVLLILILLTGTNALLPDPTYASDDDAMRWVPYNIPSEGENGGCVLAAGSDVKYLTSANDNIMYASVSGLEYSLYRSIDGGSIE